MRFLRGLSIIIGIVLFVASSSLVLAHGGGGGGSGGSKPKARTAINVVEPQVEDTESHKEIHGKLIQEKNVGGFELRFKVVDVKDSVPDGGSHNLLVNIKRDGRTQYKLSVTSSVNKTDGSEKSKSMMILGDWYLAGYDLPHNEEYGITVSFDSLNGENHSSTINYP